MALPRGLRNNNPGNIEFGDFARRHGATGSDGRFAIFPDIASGVTAMRSLLGSYQSRGLTTVAQMINRWAPPSDNNPTSAYAQQVASAMGVGVNDPVQPSDNMIAAMVSVENDIPFQEAAGLVGGRGIAPTAQSPAFGGGRSTAQPIKPPAVQRAPSVQPVQPQPFVPVAPTRDSRSPEWPRLAPQATQPIPTVTPMYRQAPQSPGYGPTPNAALKAGLNQQPRTLPIFRNPRLLRGDR